ncbi:MAG: ribosomal protein S18-alanine N-acetyltransferase [Clostridia bacterium]|nr:ribosomal protein S18-alanine N-acetyltransferase [Clostridia bacterium]
MVIRRMTLADVSQVHGIEHSTFATPWSLDSFEKEAVNPCARYLVAELDGKVIGFAGLWLVLDEGHVTNIAIAEDYRGKGYGRALTQALMQYASNLGITYVTLEVRRSNERAQNLYKSLGFVSVGVRKRYYEDNQEDAFLMVNQNLPEAQADFEEAETVHE